MDSLVERRLADLIYYVGQHQLRAGRVALAVILWRSDFDMYRLRGQPITGARYIKAPEPGYPAAPRNLVDAVRTGLRWGRIQQSLMAGNLSWPDACWVAHQWRNGVPV